jgi:hypothetical protein
MSTDSFKLRQIYAAIPSRGLIAMVLFPSSPWKALLFTAGLLLFCATNGFGNTPAASQPSAQALDVVRAYLKAIHARDSRSAYRLISAADRKIRDEQTYVKSQESLAGFALLLARQLVADMEVRVLEQDLAVPIARVDVAYQVPTGDELSARLFDWNSQKLNRLAPAEQKQMVADLTELKRRGKMVLIEGRETFHLVREKTGWKIALNWASRSRVVFKPRVPRGDKLEVQFRRNDFLVGMDEPFQVGFRLKNRSARPIVARLKHKVEPLHLTDHVEMIACGSLAPVRLEPGETRELSSSYILGNVPAQSRIAIIYDFSASAPGAN